MYFLPVPLVIDDLEYVGSTVVDSLVDLIISFYDLVAGTGSSMDLLSSI
ncbi:hypothetical protein SFC07_04690 [Corynebacterium callunae]